LSPVRHLSPQLPLFLILACSSLYRGLTVATYRAWLAGHKLWRGAPRRTRRPLGRPAAPSSLRSLSLSCHLPQPEAEVQGGPCGPRTTLPSAQPKHIHVVCAGELIVYCTSLRMAFWNRDSRATDGSRLRIFSSMRPCSAAVKG
jgi:hypothetical protein